MLRCNGIPLAPAYGVHSPTVFAFHFAFVPVQLVVRSAHKLFSLVTLLVAQGRRGTVVWRNGHDFLPACVHLQIALRPVNRKLLYRYQLAPLRGGLGDPLFLPKN